MDVSPENSREKEKHPPWQIFQTDLACSRRNLPRTKFSPPGESLEATRCRGNYRTNWNSDKTASKNLSAIEHVMLRDLEARSKRLRLHVVFALLLVELALLLSRRILVLLVLGDEVIHVALRFSELHLINALAPVPVQERLAAEHSCELLGHALEHFLDRSCVADEAHSHLQPLRRDVADAALHVVRDPLDEIGAVLILHVQHLLVDLLRRHAASEETSRREVAAVTRVCSAHHVFGVEHLLRQLRHGQRAVLLGATRRERREAIHEEMQPREGNHVSAELAQVAVELAREADGAGDARQARTHEVVEVTVRRGRQLQGAEADIV